MNIEQARHNMIEQQIRTWEVLDQDVLNLLNDIHREDFVPESYRNLAFADIRIPIGHDQSTMMPKVEARLLQSLDLQGTESVLEIGTGCGYLTALLANAADTVKSIDIYPDFIESVKNKLFKTGINNVELECIDIYSFFENANTYDVVVVTGSLPKMDDRFLNLLNSDGKMFIIVGESPAMEAQLIRTTTSSSWSSESLFETDLPALIGAERKETFEF